MFIDRKVIDSCRDDGDDNDDIHNNKDDDFQCNSEGDDGVIRSINDTGSQTAGISHVRVSYRYSSLQPVILTMRLVAFYAIRHTANILYDSQSLWQIDR